MRVIVWGLALTLMGCGADKSERDDDADLYTIGDGDCDDDNKDINPGRPELCNGLDDDCDGSVDEEAVDSSVFYGDGDGDGYGVLDDSVLACEAPAGYVSTPGDCNDADAGRGPEDPEICNGLDDDCDGLIDDEDINEADKWARLGVAAPGGPELGKTELWPDADDDRHPSIVGSAWFCVVPPGFRGAPADSSLPNQGWDCNDADDTTFPGAPEAVGGGDKNCDSAVSCYADADEDGFGAEIIAHDVNDPTCSELGVALVEGDCNDEDRFISPDADELCEPLGVDEDCDGLVDDDDPSLTDAAVYYRDSDGDGYGDPDTSRCGSAAGWVLDDQDCDDTTSDRSPDGVEICDGLDDDCDGHTDEDVAGAPTWYLDGDGDGYGNDQITQDACDMPTGYVDEGGDCDDSTIAIGPEVSEICNGDDDDCDGEIDDSAVDGTLYWFDEDGDGYGAGDPTRLCAAPPSYVDNADDCDDEDSASAPGAPILACDGLDNDCDFSTFEPGGVTLDGVTVASLADAVAAASPGSRIALCEGEHTGSGLVLAQDVSVVGLGSEISTFVRGLPGDTVFVMSDGSELNGLTITGGAGRPGSADTEGGAIFVMPGATVDLDSLIIADSEAAAGAGIFVGVGATADLNEVVVENNRGVASILSEGGGVFLDDNATLTFFDLRIRDNRAGICGGMSMRDGSTAVGSGGHVAGNRATSLHGGGVCGLAAELAGWSIRDNHSDNSGGGVWGGDLTLTDVDLIANTAGLSGGGIYVSGPVLMTRGSIDQNGAGIDGGGAYVAGADSVLELVDSAVYRNSVDFFASDGGGVAISFGELICSNTDWGSDVANNAPHDVSRVWQGGWYDYDGLQSFSCADTAGNACP